jgi:hypothetical protein
MRRFRVLVGLAAIACMLGAGAASAYASEFETRYSEKLLGKQIGSEEFVVYPMTIQCAKASSKGEGVPEGKKPSFVITTTYATCTTLGGLVKATVSPGEWEFLAEKEGKAEGAIRLLKEIVIKPAIGTGCKFVIPAQETRPKESVLLEDGFLAPTGHGNYAKEGQEKLDVYSKYSGLEYEATGWPCTGPKSAAELTEQKTETSTGEGGRFVGATKVEALSGDLTWIY